MSALLAPGFDIYVSSRSYFPTIDDPEIECVLIPGDTVLASRVGWDHEPPMTNQESRITNREWRFLLHDYRPRVEERTDQRRIAFPGDQRALHGIVPQAVEQQTPGGVIGQMNIGGG